MTDATPLIYAIIEWTGFTLVVVLMLGFLLRLYAKREVAHGRHV